jgi:hypothetical protein
LLLNEEIRGVIAKGTKNRALGNCDGGIPQTYHPFRRLPRLVQSGLDLLE